MSEPIPLAPEQRPRTGRERRRTRHQDSNWDLEYGKDVWQLRVLGIKDRQLARLSFEGIPQSWLRALAKRWARWRFTSNRDDSRTCNGIGRATDLRRSRTVRLRIHRCR